MSPSFCLCLCLSLPLSSSVCLSVFSLSLCACARVRACVRVCVCVCVKKQNGEQFRNYVKLYCSQRAHNVEMYQRRCNAIFQRCMSAGLYRALKFFFFFLSNIRAAYVLTIFSDSSSHKGDNFCDFLFALLYTNFLERGLLLKEVIYSEKNEICSQSAFTSIFLRLW